MSTLISIHTRLCSFKIWNFQTIFCFKKQEVFKMEGLHLSATGLLFELSWVDIFPLAEAFMDGQTADPVCLPSVWFVKHLVLALLETGGEAAGRGRQHSAGKNAFFVLFILKSYSECLQMALVLKSLAFYPVDLTEFWPHDIWRVK